MYLECEGRGGSGGSLQGTKGFPRPPGSKCLIMVGERVNGKQKTKGLKKMQVFHGTNIKICHVKFVMLR